MANLTVLIEEITSKVEANKKIENKKSEIISIIMKELKSYKFVGSEKFLAFMNFVEKDLNLAIQKRNITKEVFDKFVSQVKELEVV